MSHRFRLPVWFPLRHGLARLRHERLLLACLLVAAVLALIDPQPPGAWLDWLDWPTLAGLAGLMVAAQGFGDSALANLIALRLARGQMGMAQFHRVSMPFLLVCACAVYVLVLV